MAGIASWYEYTNSQGIATRSDPAYSQSLAWMCSGRYLDPEDWATIEEKYGNYLYQLQQDQRESNGDYSDHWAVRDYTLNAENIQCPALIVHGLNDYNVRTKEFDLMYQAYEKAGVPAKILLHQDGHLTPTYPSGGLSFLIGEESYDAILNSGSATTSTAWTTAWRTWPPSPPRATPTPWSGTPTTAGRRRAP